MRLFIDTTIIYLLIANVVNLSNIYEISAFSRRSGSCSTGRAIGSSHEGDDNGALSSAGYEVVINGEVLDESSNKTLAANATHELKIRVNGSVKEDFKGFLVRASGKNGENATGSLTILEGEQDIQVLESTGETGGFMGTACAEDVAGICHTSAQSKKSVTASLSYPTEAEFLLEVTMVSGNKGLVTDGWYYSPYDITFITNASDVNNTTMLDPEGRMSVPGGAFQGSLKVTFVVAGILSICMGWIGL